MSFRSGYNTDLVVRNLKVNGEFDGQDMKFTDLEASGDTTLNNLNASGDTFLNNLKVEGTLLTDGDVQVDGDTTIQALFLNGNLVVDNEIITPGELGNLYGSTSNIQSQLDGKAGLSNPIFNGTVTMNTSECKGFSYVGNDGGKYPQMGNNNFACIAGNMSGGSGEMDFVNLGHDYGNPDGVAFEWHMMTSATGTELLMRLFHDAKLMTYGLLNATLGIKTTTLTATGHSQLADVSTNNLTVTGGLHVTGDITGGNQPGFEVVCYNLGGNDSAVSRTLALSHNTTNTTNYCVFPSVYDGYHGSSGTYNTMDTAGILSQMVISNRTSSGFTFNIKKSSGENVNIWFTFLVVYNCQGTNYPVSY